MDTRRPLARDTRMLRKKISRHTCRRALPGRPTDARTIPGRPDGTPGRAGYVCRVFGTAVGCPSDPDDSVTMCVSLASPLDH